MLTKQLTLIKKKVQVIFFRMKEVRKVKSDLLCSISVLNGTVYDGEYSGDALECIRDLSGLVYI